MKKVKIERAVAFSLALIVGVLLVLYSLNTFHKYNTYKRVTADVTSCSVKYDDEGHATYSVYVMYSVDGVDYKGYFSDSRSYNVGSSVTVRYNPDDPSDMVFQDVGGNYFILGIGAMFIVAAIIGFINPQKIYTEEDVRRVQEEQYNKWLNKQ